jgi:hypothetical protein
MQIDVSFRHSRNADSSIRESWESDPNVTRASGPFAKHCAEMTSTDEGMQIEVRRKQWQKAESPMHDSLDPASNVTDERRPQKEKHSAPIISTDDGILREESSGQNRKSDFSIRKRRAPVSNLTLDRLSQQRKEPSPIVSTDDGMQISLSN